MLIFEIPLRTCYQGEIGRRSAGDNVLEREGYAVSAGFSLGLVALGMPFCFLATELFFKANSTLFGSRPWR